MLAYWVSDPNIQGLYLEPVYTTREEVDALLDKYIASYADPDYYRWAIIEKDSGKCIGQIAYFLMNTAHHYGELEYCVGSQFQRRGYMTEAARAVIDYGFTGINLHRVQICHRAGNEASRGVILKCGCTYEGTLREIVHVDGKYVDRLCYSVLRDEWDQYHIGSSKLQSVFQKCPNRENTVQAASERLYRE